MRKEEWQLRLQHPAPSARNRTRWWWYGCAVEEAEIIRELDEMQAAGLGGIELQILYSLQADDPKKNIHNSQYLSPEFLARIRFAAQQAKQRGMQFDLTLGSSWPFGGPFIPEELCAQNLLPYCFDVQGPCTFSQDLTTVVYGRVVGAVMGKMENARMLPETIVDIRQNICDKELFHWPWGKEIREVQVPEGLHKIVLFAVNDKKLRVLKPLPGGEGLVMDHNRRDAMRCFLSWAGDPIVQAVGEGMIDNFFCDSIEVEGHNWTDIVYEEFEKRRGYDLHPYLYALWGEIEGMTQAVRYDYQKTLAELTVENFFRELTVWCHEKKSLSRIQAHGTWGDILQAYGAADIPEGETFSAFDRCKVNTVHRRLASSAGHVYGNPIISNESFTWLRFPRFVVTPENIKAAADSIFLDGMNQIVNHGYSYSRQGDERLAFYASSHISHTNTWWKYYPHISRYINRVCDFLQQGTPVATTAIYLPQHDIWAKMPLADIHMSMQLDERLDPACVDAVQKAGYWFDYVNDDVLEHWQQYPYDTLLLIECDRIPSATLQQIVHFAQAGGCVIAADHLPQQPCGLLHREEEAAALQTLCGQLEKTAIITADKYAGLIAALRAVKQPDVQVSHPQTVGFVHRRTQTEELYFIANIDAAEKTETLRFAGVRGSAALFDPMTGLEKPVLSVEQTGSAVTLTVELEAFQSLLVIFGEENPATPLKKPETWQGQLCDLSEGWQLSVPQMQFERTYARLNCGWEQEPCLHYYSGSGCYRKTFTLTAEQLQRLHDCSRVWLQLEHLGETATVRINGRKAGELFMRPYRLAVDGLLYEGENVLEIEADNLLINQVLDPQLPQPQPQQKLLPHWPYISAPLVEERKKRLYYWREREMIAEPLPSGLWGRVELVGAR